MFSNLWGRITGADKRKQTPDQQAIFLGRVGDYIVVFPYGLYGDLPADTLLKEIAPGVAVPVTVERPDDTKQGEPVFFHPLTKTRIIPRNNGDLDIITQDGAGDVNITTVNANITASATVKLDTPEVTITGNATINGNLQIDGDLNNDGKATLGGAGGLAIARIGDAVAGGVITGGSANHTAT